MNTTVGNTGVLFNSAGLQRYTEAQFNEIMAEMEQREAQLKAALEAANSADKAKNDFLAKMSHEIRTPMNSIIGFSELALDDDAISDRTAGFLNKILNNAKWLLGIINDILDISKVQSGQMTLERVPFNLCDVFTHCQSVMLPLAKENGISLFCYVEPSVGKKLVGDPAKLTQVLINMLSNAVKFTYAGMVKFLASFESLDNNKARVRFEIEDSGIGIGSEQIDKIFSPFVQADDSVSRKYGGTGLGLTITREIIEMMGGELKVESTPHVGSKFSFELIFDLVDVPDEEAALPQTGVNEIEKPNFEGKILVCEDNVMNQQLITEHLARVGIQAVVAQNGKEGVDFVLERLRNGRRPFDLIFMDIHMPVMNGLEAAAAITDAGVKTPIVALTANIMQNDLEFYTISGMKRCLGKPFTSQELWKCLLEYLTPVTVSQIDRYAYREQDEKLLKRLKLNFIKSNQDIHKYIRRAVADGDNELGIRLAHTLKSNAAQIGEERLREAAAAVETMLSELDRPYKSGESGAGSVVHRFNDVAEGLMTILESELEVVLVQLRPMLLESIAASVNDVSDEQLGQLLAELEPMLADHNPECMNLLDELAAFPEMDELTQLIEDFEFKRAMILLDRLRDDLRG